MPGGRARGQRQRRAGDDRARLELGQPGLDGQQRRRSGGLEPLARRAAKGLHNGIAALGVDRHGDALDRRRRGRRDGLQRIDSQDLGPHGVGEGLGRSQSHAQAGERAGPDGYGHQLHLAGLPGYRLQDFFYCRGQAGRTPAA